MIVPYNKLSLILVLILSFKYVIAAEAPRNWPWRGISIQTTSANPTDIISLFNKLRINNIRIQLHACQKARFDGIGVNDAWEEILAILPDYLSITQKLGITAVINVSKFCLGGDQTKSSFWYDDSEKQRILNQIEKIVRITEKFDRSLIAYDFFSEPKVISFTGETERPPEWNNFLMAMIQRIRLLDNESWIVVSSGPGMDPAGYRDFEPVDDTHVIYNAHMYIPTLFTHQGLVDIPIGVHYPGTIKCKFWEKERLRQLLQYVRLFQVQHNAMIWIGEFSAIRWAAGAEQYIKDLVAIFDDYHWGWNYFSATGFHGWNPDYNTYYPGPDASDWKNNFVGEESVRWQTLREIFDVEQGYNHQ